MLELRIEPLFGLGIEQSFVSDLDAGQLPDTLRTHFQAHDVDLSPDARVIVQQVGSRWKVDDLTSNSEHRIRRENEMLNVYNFKSCPNCGEVINARAEKCIWCEEFVEKSIRADIKRKSIWDWLSLLVIPGVLILGGAVLNSAQQAQRDEIEKQRAQAAALEAYLDDKK
jgi:hypothetical protein